MASLLLPSLLGFAASTCYDGGLDGGELMIDCGGASCLPCGCEPRAVNSTVQCNNSCTTCETLAIWTSYLAGNRTINLPYCDGDSYDYLDPTANYNLLYQSPGLYEVEGQTGKLPGATVILEVSEVGELMNLKCSGIDQSVKPPEDTTESLYVFDVAALIASILGIMFTVAGISIYGIIKSRQIGKLTDRLHGVPIDSPVQSPQP